MTVRVAVVQPPSFAGAEEHRNAAQACAFVDEAADGGAGYVVFPEGYPGPYSGPMENDVPDSWMRSVPIMFPGFSAVIVEPGAIGPTMYRPGAATSGL